MGMFSFQGSSDPVQAFFGGGATGGINETRQGKDLLDQTDSYRSLIMDATDPREVNNGDIYSKNTSLTNPYATAQAANVNWKQAPITQMQAAQGQAAQGRASMAEAAAINQGEQAQARANQNALVASLQGTAAGQGPSVAQEQLRQSTAANVANQASAAQSARGSARLAAMRNAANNQASLQQQMNSQAAGLRAQEIASAQGMLGGALAGQRSQDIGLASQAAQLAQQSNQFNAGNQQQMALANLGYGNQFGMQNIQNMQGANQFNAGAANLSALNYAQQANAGNQSLTLANLQAQQQANQLDLQRKQAYYDTIQKAMDSKTGVYSTLYGGQQELEKWNRDNNKGILGDALGMVGNIGLGGLF